MSFPTAGLRRAGTLVALVVLGLLLVLAIRHLDLARAARGLVDADLRWVLAALLCYVAILPLWGLQWWLLAPRTAGSTPARMFGVVAMTSSVLNTTPMLVGEAAGVHFLQAHAGVDRASGLAVLAMDQLLVGLAKIAVLSAAASVLPLPHALLAGIRVFVGGVTALLVTLVLLARSQAGMRREIAARLPARASSILERAIRALAPLRSPARAGGAFALALLKKGCELLAILAMQHAFGLELPVWSPLVLLAALNVATLLPLVPGNIGVFEAAMVVAYGWLGVAPERAIGLAVVQHVVYFVALALPGYPWLVRTIPSRSAVAAP